MQLINQALALQLAIGITVLLSGCSHFLPEHKDVTPTLQSSYSVSGTGHYSNQWWTKFDEPQLTTLINTAINTNFSLKSAVERVQQAAAFAGITEAARYPELNASLDSKYYRESYAQGRDIRSNNKQKLALSSRWEIDLWGKNRFEASAAYFDLLATEERLQVAAQGLAGDITRLWYQLTEQQQSLVILKHQLANTKIFAEITAHRYRTGQGSISALWRQEQLLESLESKYQQAVNKAQVLEKQLNVLLGRSPATPVDWHYSTFPTLSLLPDAGIPAQMLERRPDIRALWYQYESKRHQAAAATAARLPNITISAGASSEDWSNAFELWQLDLGARINLPLFNAGKLELQQRRAESSTEQALYDYTQGVLSAIAEVETNLIEELSQKEQLDSLHQQTLQAKRSSKWNPSAIAGECKATLTY